MCHLQTNLTKNKKYFVPPVTKLFNHLILRDGRFLFNYLSIFMWQLKGSDKQMTGMPRADRKSEQNFNAVSPSACINFY